MSPEEVLRSLLELDRPLVDVLRDLASLKWDSDVELAVLRPTHVMAILNRYASGTLAAADVEGWANAVEGRDDIGFEPRHRELLAEAIFDLANPVLQGALTRDLANRWLARLRPPSEG